MLKYIREKSYYLLGGTLLIIILIIVIASCSNSSIASYEKIEEKMTLAAKDYYSTRKDKLPNIDGSTVKVNIGTLVEAELLETVYDPADSTKECSGYVEVTRVDNEYSYTPFLSCGENYKQSYLTEVIKSTKNDEYGNGVYEMGGEYIYRGKYVDNYIKFNELLWRIVKIDNAGDIKLVLARYTDQTYSYDTAYNSVAQSNYGITTDYIHTDIRKSLGDYYKEVFTKESKSKIIGKRLCVGTYNLNDYYSKEKECSVQTQTVEKVSLLNGTDYQSASLSDECKTIDSQACSNYNYLAEYEFNTWILNPMTTESYRAFMLSINVYDSYANEYRNINPVIYLSGKTIKKDGIGTIDNPYIIK